MSDAVRSSLRALAERAQRGDLDPLTGLHGYTPEAAKDFRHAAVLALLTPGHTHPLADHSTHPLASDSADTPADRAASETSIEPIGADLFLVQRSPWLRHHPGQIALPGGGLESGDAGPEAAAVRETEEETGIAPERVEVVGTLPSLMLPISSFVVTPVLGWAPWIPPVTHVDQGEVLHTLRVSVDTLLDPQMRSTIVHGEHTSPGFRTEAGWVWGFTGILLDHLFTLLGWTRPWDTSVNYTMTWDEARGAQLLDP